MEEKKIFRHAIHIAQLIRREKIYLIKYLKILIKSQLKIYYLIQKHNRKIEVGLKFHWQKLAD